MEQSFIRKIKRRDRWARRVITTGGISVIFSVLLIMFLIVEVAVPLFRPARVELVAGFDLPQGTILAAGVDDYMENAYLLEQERGFLFFRLPEGAPQGEILPEPPGEGLVLKGAERNGSHRFSLLWSDGSMTLERVTFAPEFDGEGKRSIVYRLVRLAEFPPEEGGIPVRSVARFVEGAGSTRASLMPDGTVQVTRITVTEDFFGDVEEERSLFTLEDPEGSPLTTFALSSAGDALYAAAAGGALLRWNLASDDPELLERSRAFEDGREITALALIYGDISLAVGDEKGGVSTWFPVPGEEGEGKGSGGRGGHALSLRGRHV